MSSVNKLKNAWLSTDTSLTGTYQNCSLLNEGKTELKNDVIIDTRLAINKNINVNSDYKVDINGNLNLSGEIYKNGVLFTTSSSSTLNDVLGNGNTTTYDINMSNKNIQNSGFVQTNSIKSTTIGGNITLDNNLNVNNLDLLNVHNINTSLINGLAFNPYGITGATGAAGSSIPNIQETTLNNDFFPTFSQGTTGSQQLYIDQQISYNPSTALLSLSNINATGQNNYLKNISSYPKLWTQSNYTSYHSQAIGLNNISNINGISTHNDNTVCGYNNGNSITSTTFNNNSIYGVNNLVDSGTQTFTSNTIMGYNNFNTLNTGSLTSMATSTILGTGNFTTTNIFGGVVAGLLMVGNNNGLNSSAASVNAISLIGNQCTTTGAASNSIVCGTQCGTGGNRNTVLGYLSGAYGNDNVIIGNNISFTGNSTLVLGGTDASANPLSVNIQGEMRLSNAFINRSINLTITTNITLPTSYFGSPIKITSSTNSFTITLPSVLISGGILEINNDSIYQHTLSSSSNILGRFGTGGLTIKIESGQSMLLSTNGTNFSVDKVWGVPYSYQRYHNTTQTLTTIGTNYAILFNTDAPNTISNSTAANSTCSWNGTKLAYNTTTGVFTNSTGYNMCINVRVDLNSTTPTATRYAWIQTSARNVNTQLCMSTLMPNVTNAWCTQATFLLCNGDTFNISGQASVANTIYGSATASAQNRITITRIS